jgi:hypothetical protein
MACVMCEQPGSLICTHSLSPASQKQLDLGEQVSTTPVRWCMWLQLPCLLPAMLCLCRTLFKYGGQYGTSDFVGQAAGFGWNNSRHTCQCSGAVVITFDFASLTVFWL